jgi:hypothetical protein
MKPGYVFLGWSLAMGDASQIIDATYVVPNGLTIKLYPIWEITNNPSILLQQYLSVGLRTLESYHYEVIVFSSLMVLALSGMILYRKRVNDVN